MQKITTAVRIMYKSNICDLTLGCAQIFSLFPNLSVIFKCTPEREVMKPEKYLCYCIDVGGYYCC
jgi:hypothetical protein